MTEKRFEFRGSDMIDKITGETTLCNKDGFEDVVCQLNEFAEENEQLKKQIEELKVDLKMEKIDGVIDRMAQRPMRW